MPHFEEDGRASSQVCRGVVVHPLWALTIRWLLAVQPSNGGRCDYVSRILDSLTFGGATRQAIPLAARF